MNLTDATKAYLAAKDNNLRTEQTHASYTKTLWGMSSRIGWAQQVTSVTEDHLVDFITDGAVSNATMAARRTRVTSFFKWYGLNHDLPSNPADGLAVRLRLDYRPVRKHNWLTRDEVKTILDTPDRSDDMGLRDELILRLGFTCGLRRAEIVSLTWGQINLDRAEITVIGKGGKVSAVYMTPATAHSVDMMYRRNGHRHDDMPVIVSFSNTGTTRLVHWGSPIVGRTVGTLVAKYSRMTSIPFRPHDMRRTFAAMLQDLGADIEQISKALRHSNIGTTQRYLAQRQDAAYQAVKKVGLDL